MKVPVPSSTLDETLTQSDLTSSEDDIDDTYESSYSRTPKIMSQFDLDDLVRDLDLPKESAELLGSRLRERNFLAPDSTFAWYRQREK